MHACKPYCCIVSLWNALVENAFKSNTTCENHLHLCWELPVAGWADDFMNRFYASKCQKNRPPVSHPLLQNGSLALELTICSSRALYMGIIHTLAPADTNIQYIFVLMWHTVPILLSGPARFNTEHTDRVYTLLRCEAHEHCIAYEHRLAQDLDSIMMRQTHLRCSSKISPDWSCPNWKNI